MNIQIQGNTELKLIYILMDSTITDYILRKIFIRLSIGKLDLRHLIPNVWVVDSLLPDHVGLPHVLVHGVHLVINVGWMGLF